MIPQARRGFPPPTPPGGRGARDRGFSLIEVVICVVIVGVMFAAAMTSLGAARTSTQKINDRGRGRMLAQSLMTEILGKDYHDPGGWTSIGPGPNETTRATFDDVDDYNGWTASPPQYVDGASIPGFDSRWSRGVQVQWSQASGTTLDTPSGSDTGLKTITVTVKRGDVVEARLTAIRSAARPTVESREVLSP